VEKAGKGLTADETTFRKLVLRVAATARASSVLPTHQHLILSFLGPAIKSTSSFRLFERPHRSAGEGKKEETYQFLGDRIVIHPWVV
jgi:hypothetical protein